MSIQVSMFPERLALMHSHEPNYGWTVLLRDEQGNCIHLTSKLADELQTMLAERHAKQEAA